MLGSLIVYTGLVIAFIGVVSLLKRSWRRRGAALAGAGVLLVVVALVLPAPERRAGSATRLDEFDPRWQFNEVHTIHVAVPPDRASAAIKPVRADEILFFRTLIWIRRFGRSGPESVLDPSRSAPLLDVVTRSGFIYLADEPARELVVGTVIAAPRGTRGTLTPAVFKKRLRPGFVLAVMNFLVRPDGRGGSIISTETRVYANSDSVRRRFAAYWRVIYPGSAIIRRMWLRAIAKRAEGTSLPARAGNH